MKDSCKFASSGCNYPEGECGLFCMNQDQARRMAEEAELPFSPYLFTEWASPDERKTRTMYTEAQVREAIAAALVKHMQQEPVAYLETITGQVRLPDDEHRLRFPKAYVPLYTHPIPSQQEERKPQTVPMEHSHIIK